jgi:hypothetical protein
MDVCRSIVRNVKQRIQDNLFMMNVLVSIS